MEPDSLSTTFPLPAAGDAAAVAEAPRPDAAPEVAALTSGVAPRRALRLVAQPIPEKPVIVPRAVAAVPSTPLANLDPFLHPQAHKVSPIERKLAELNDAQLMLQTLDTEMNLQRAKRLHGGEGSRQGIRAMAIALFFALLIAALGAMSYLQSKLAQSGFHRRAGGPAEVTTTTANPAPAPSTPAAAPTR